MKRIKQNGTIQTPVKAVAVGVAIALIVTLVGCCIGAVCIDNEYMNISTAKMVSMIIIMISGFIGAIIAEKISKTGKTIVCLLVPASLCLIMMSVGALFFGGLGGQALIGIVVSGAASLGALLFNLKGKSRRNGHFKRSHHR